MQQLARFGMFIKNVLPHIGVGKLVTEKQRECSKTSKNKSQEKLQVSKKKHSKKTMRK